MRSWPTIFPAIRWLFSIWCRRASTPEPKRIRRIGPECLPVVRIHRKFEISDLDITADSKLAFSHSIQHFSCTDAKGNKLEMTMRATDGYRKVKGKWLIVHEHISAPIDLATGKADLTSKP